MSILWGGLMPALPTGEKSTARALSRRRPLRPPSLPRGCCLACGRPPVLPSLRRPTRNLPPQEDRTIFGRNYEASYSVLRLPHEHGAFKRSPEARTTRSWGGAARAGQRGGGSGSVQAEWPSTTRSTAAALRGPFRCRSAFGAKDHRHRFTHALLIRRRWLRYAEPGGVHAHQQIAVPTYPDTLHGPRARKPAAGVGLKNAKFVGVIHPPSYQP